MQKNGYIFFTGTTDIYGEQIITVTATPKSYFEETGYLSDQHDETLDSLLEEFEVVNCAESEFEYGGDLSEEDLMLDLINAGFEYSEELKEFCTNR